MICGIYRIHNLINNKNYIGQSIDIKTRWAKHKTSTDDFYIHKALRKYGIKNFIFEILEECSEDELDEKEKFYIQFFNSKIPFGYNMVKGGSNGAGVAKRKIVLQYDLKGQYINTFESISQAEKITGINNSNISQCCLGKRNYAGNYQWRYDNSNLPLKNFVLLKKEKEEKIQIKQEKQNRIIIQLDKNKNVINKYNTCTEASQKTGIHCGNLNSCLNGKRKTAGGYYWKYEIKE